MCKHTLAILFLAGLSAAALAAQVPAVPLPPVAVQAAPESLRTAYTLGPEDQLLIRALQVPEISEKPVRIDTGGFVRLPMVGRVQASGLTVEQFENELSRRLQEFIKEPEVAVTVTEYRSQPVSVLGAVRTPGVQQVQGRKTLLELLSMAGGIDAEAGHSVKITRRKEYGPIPLESAKPDESGAYGIADVDLSSLLEARNPRENIEVKPYDVITVPRGALVYVMGQVKRPGGFVLRQQESVSALQALALAEGLDRTASPQNSRILRNVPGAPQRSEIYVDLRKILSGKSPDIALLPNDVLLIPNSVPKSAMIRGLESALQIGTGIAIYRR